MAAHESPRTTKLYDRTSDQVTLDEVERMQIQAVGRGPVRRVLGNAPISAAPANFLWFRAAKIEFFR
jgi:hypothetical protein